MVSAVDMRAARCSLETPLTASPLHTHLAVRLGAGCLPPAVGEQERAAGALQCRARGAQAEAAQLLAVGHRPAVDGHLLDGVRLQLQLLTQAGLPSFRTQAAAAAAALVNGQGAHTTVSERLPLRWPTTRKQGTRTGVP